MSNELERFTQRSPGLRAGRQDMRRVERDTALTLIDAQADVQVAAFKVAGAAALATHTMELVVELDHERRALAGNDETLNALLSNVEMNFIAQASRIQRNAFSKWDI